MDCPRHWDYILLNTTFFVAMCIYCVSVPTSSILEQPQVRGKKLKRNCVNRFEGTRDRLDNILRFVDKRLTYIFAGNFRFHRKFHLSYFGQNSAWVRDMSEWQSVKDITWFIIWMLQILRRVIWHVALRWKKKIDKKISPHAAVITSLKILFTTYYDHCFRPLRCIFTFKWRRFEVSFRRFFFESSIHPQVVHIRILLFTKPNYFPRPHNEAKIWKPKEWKLTLSRPFITARDINTSQW